MEQVFGSINSLFARYGARSAAIVLATVAIVNLLKKPFVAKARRAGVPDKSVYTRYVTFLPMLVAGVLAFLCDLTAARFDFSQLDAAKIMRDALTLGALAIALYESVKKQLEAYSAKRLSERDDAAGADENRGTGGENPDAAEAAEPLDPPAEEESGSAESKTAEKCGDVPPAENAASTESSDDKITHVTEGTCVGFSASEGAGEGGADGENKSAVPAENGIKFSANG